MDWQALAAILIAVLCGVWVVRRWLRVLRRHGGRVCALCDECRARQPGLQLPQISRTDHSSQN